MDIKQKREVLLSHLKKIHRKEKPYILSYIPQTWGMIGDHWEVQITDEQGKIIDKEIVYTKGDNTKYEIINRFKKTDLSNSNIRVNSIIDKNTQ